MGGTIAGKRWVHRPILLAALLLASAVVLALVAESSRAVTTINVTSTADATDARPGNGTCASPTGQCTLRAAIQEANALPGTDTINVPAGTYALTRAPLNDNSIINGDLDITDALTINGASKTTTIIDGGNPKPGSPPEATGLDRLFEVHPLAGNVRFSGVTIQEGYDDERGGAIFNAGDANVTVSDSRLLRNYAGSGGAIENLADGAVTVVGSSFTGNKAVDGGAINNSGDPINGNAGTLTVKNSTFAMNRVTAEGGAINNGGAGTAIISENTTFSKNVAQGEGGAIQSGDQSNVAVSNATFTENSGLNGGGFANSGDGLITVVASEFLRNEAQDGAGFSNNSDGTVTVSGTKFSENAAQGQGGAVIVDSGAVKIDDSDLLANSAVIGGGGISYRGDGAVPVGDSAIVEDSTLDGNTTPGTGGGLIHEGDGDIKVASSTFSNNQAGSGGGIFADGNGDMTTENITVSGNKATNFGGGILVGSTTNIIHTTVANNSARRGGGISNGGGAAIAQGQALLRNTIVASSPLGGNCAGIITSEGGNLDSANTCRLQAALDDLANTVPRMGPLQDNGGPTLTHALLGTSAAVDNATDVLPPEAVPPEADQRGVLRPQGQGFDIGAYELQPSQQVCPDTPQTISAIADSTISQSSLDENSGNDSTLEVRSKSGQQNARSLVRFALPAAGTTCEVVEAKLQMYSSSATPGRTLRALRVTEEWSEYGVTWNNQPATTAPAATVASRMGLLNWNVTSQVQAMYAGGGISRGFLIRDATENDATSSPGQSFHSREKAPDRPPKLTITFGPG